MLLMGMYGFICTIALENNLASLGKAEDSHTLGFRTLLGTCPAGNESSGEPGAIPECSEQRCPRSPRDSHPRSRPVERRTVVFVKWSRAVCSKMD